MVTSLERAPVPFGIQNEGSTIRAHVGVVARRVYVFQTRFTPLDWVRKFPKKTATQPGYDGITGWGHVVPWDAIPDIRTIDVPEVIFYIEEESSISERGGNAVSLVESLLRTARFPLWVNGSLVSNLQLQRRGEDIHVNGMWKIQVKCDFRCGERSRGGSGNLFIQTAEINPLAIH